MQKITRLEKQFSLLEEKSKELEKQMGIRTLQSEAFRAVLAKLLGQELTTRQLELIEIAKEEPNKFLLANIFLAKNNQTVEKPDEELKDN